MNGEVDLLRRAAALMRERATKARTGDHVPGDFWMHDLMWRSKRYDVTAVDEGTVIAENLDRWTAEHIAGFGPAVALAVADWLDAAADDDRPRTPVDHAALAVAAAYMGEATP